MGVGVGERERHRERTDIVRLGDFEIRGKARP